MEKFFLSQCPNVRMRMTIDREMELDPEGKIFSPQLYQAYLAQHKIALQKQDGILRSIVLVDGILALFIGGQSIIVPGINLSLKDIPAAQEIMAVLSSFAFMMLCLTFANAQLYEAITQAFSKRAASKLGVDPDFLSAADTYTELFLKVFRTKMNIWGPDFYVPTRSFRLYYGLLTFLVGLSIFAMIGAHFCIVAFAIWPAGPWSTVPIILAVITLLMNLTGVLAVSGKSFPFEVPEFTQSTPPDTPEADPLTPSPRPPAP